MNKKEYKTVTSSNAKLRNTLSLVSNVAMAVLVAIAVGYFFTKAGNESGVGNMKLGGTSCFVFFTVDSNIFAAICCLLVVPFNVKAIATGKDEIPKWVLVLKMVGTTAVSLTFFVVLFYLGPIMGFQTAYEGSCFELHLICPLLAIISFCLFEKGDYLTSKQALLGIIPTLIYGAVYLSKVIILQQWSDFYHFNIGGFWYLSCILLFGVTYLLAFALCFINKKI